MPTKDAALSRTDGNLPAAQAVAEVVALRAGREVRLPPRFARAAVERLLATCQTTGDVVEGPCGAALTGRALGDGEWAIRVGTGRWSLNLHEREVVRHGGYLVHIFPRHTVVLAAAQARWLLRALEDVKPDELDADGRPAPWVPERQRTESLGARDEEDHDAVLLGGGDELPPLAAPPPDEGQPFIASGEIHAWFDRLSRFAGFGALPLSLSRGTTNKLGFTTGRVFYPRQGRPVRVHVTTCPNADLAEILQTLVHELSHPLSGTHDHGDAFKGAMVALASRHWGGHWFQEANARLSQSFRVVDAWVTAGIRAALRGGEPPRARAGDDGQMARVVTKIRKLRELAADQLGRPEALAATAAANDLVTSYGLESYRVVIDAGIHDQMVDRWVVLEEAAVWKRDLAHGIASASDVFSLALAKNARMHFFGRYADVLQAEYLYSISAARIERECDRHLEAWREGRDRVGHGDAVRERVSFCDSAARAFRLKLKQIVSEEASAVAGGRTRTDGLDAARQFAWEEHDKRGIGWHAVGGKSSRENAAGRELGRSLEVVRGLASTGGAPKALPPRR